MQHFLAGSVLARVHRRRLAFLGSGCVVFGSLVLGCSGEGLDDGIVAAPGETGGVDGSASGGSDSGGSTTGGAPSGSGGASTGGAPTGGAASGGQASGGTASGGSASGGSTGTADGVVGAPIGFATLNGGTQGGAAGEVVTVTNYTDLKAYAESAEPYVILVEGTISNGSSGGQIRVGSDKSIVGRGDDAFLSGIGITVSNQRNVILQNLRLTLVGVSNPSSVNGGDVVSITGTSKNVWIDHCEIYSEDPDVQTDIDKYDGLIDIRDQTGFVTVSFNYLHDHHKGLLVGAADSDVHADRKITYHHNHFRDVKKRAPTYRGATGHFFNNYVVGATDATFVLVNTCLRVEKNYYEALHYSIYTTKDSTAGKVERIGNVEVKRDSRAYPSSCVADIPYSYAHVLLDAEDVKTFVPDRAGVGKLP